MTPNIRTTEGRAIAQKACEEATAGNWRITEVTFQPNMWNLNSDLPNPPCDFTPVGTFYHGARREDAEFCALARTALPDALEYIADLESRLQAADELADAAKYFRDGVMATWHKKRVMDLDERNEALRNRLLDYDAVKR